MTRRQRLILAVARRKRQHRGYRDIEAKLVRATTAQLRREIRSQAEAVFRKSRPGREGGAAVSWIPAAPVLSEGNRT